MSQLPLEDQLRSMILKNNAPSDTALSSPNDAHPPAPQTHPQHSRQPSSPHPRGGRHPNRAQSQQLPHQTVPAGSPKPQHPQRHGPHHGRGQSGPGRPYLGQGSPQQRQQGFSAQQPSPGYVHPHMRNRSSEWHQQRGGYHQPRGPWQHQQMRQPASPAAPRPSSPGNVGPPQSFRQMAPPGLQILQRSQAPGPGHPSGPMNGPFRPGPPLYNPNQRYQQHQLQLQEQLQTQCRYLGALAAVEIPEVAMTDEELKEKEEFVQRLQDICRNEISSLPGVPSVEFKCFGSIGTGFATKGSDIDLAVITIDESDTELAQKVGPRALEKIFLDHGFGARLLTNTRVPIIKFCEKPSDELRENLKAERKKWDDLPEDEKKALLEGGPKSPGGEGNTNDAEVPENRDVVGGDDSPSPKDDDGPDADKKAPSKRKKTKGSASTSSAKDSSVDSAQKAQSTADDETATYQSPTTAQGQGVGEEKNPDVPQRREPRPEKPWLREKPMGPLDFPKEGVGIQCDLNFAGHLGIYNTQLLHCYAISDQRIRDMVIFVKAWAKTRKINSSYNGTLSSYGYALLVLHYLICIPEEPLTPDLQLLSNLPPNGTSSPKVVDVTCHGHAVKFLADEAYIREKAHSGQWSRNQDSLGALLRGFFRYYGCPGVPDRVGGFHWTRDVITFGQRKPWDRMVTKEELGWTKARVEKDSKREVRHRYLVCIQDPFERDHNVGRTVNHQGICAIREEFRRAWRILDDKAHGRPRKDLFASVDDDPPPPQYVGGQPRPSNANAQPEQANGGAPQQQTWNGQGGGGAATAAAAVVVAVGAEAGLETPLAGPLPTTMARKGIVSTVDGARRPSAGGSGTGFGAEAIAKVNGKLAEAARRGSLK